MTSKSYAKVNIYLKIVGIKGAFHEISSRFMIVDNLYDTISFIPYKNESGFCLEGKFSCIREENLIYKAYKKLLEIDSISKKVKNFFRSHKIVVDKYIPEFAGLGGGSSNVATFLKMCDKYIELKLQKRLLHDIANSLGSDINFFIDEFDSALVEGKGEIIKGLKEELIRFEVFTPPIKCNTSKVYKKYREELLKNYDKIIASNRALSIKLSSLNSKEILKNFQPQELNDLFLAAKYLYPELKEYEKKGWFFSGSGSSFFRSLD